MRIFFKMRVKVKLYPAVRYSTHQHGVYDISLCHREDGGRPAELHHQLIGLSICGRRL